MDPKYYPISSFLSSSTPSTYTTLSHLLYHLQLLKNITTISNPNVKPDLNPDVIPDVNPDVNLDVNPDINSDVRPDINPDVNPDVNPAVKPDLNPAVKNDLDAIVKPDLNPIVKPGLLPISSVEAKYQRQTKSSLRLFHRCYPFQSLPYLVTFIVSHVCLTYHPNLYHNHISWIKSTLSIIQLRVSSFHIQFHSR